MKRWMIGLLIFTCFSAGFAGDRKEGDLYISGVAFKGISDYVYEHAARGSLEPRSFDTGIYDCKPGALIFVNSVMLKKFITEVHPKIKNPYFIIVHSSDQAFNSEFESFINDSKVLRCFAQNVDIESDKVVPIPIGIGRFRHLLIKQSDPHNIKRLQDEDVVVEDVLYVNFQVRTFRKERWRANRILRGLESSLVAQRSSFKQYMLEMKKCKFVASPSGDGIDCYRTWEALLMGSIPILRPYSKYSDTPAVGNEFLYEDLPVIVVGDWTEVKREFLDQKILEFEKREFKMEKIYFPFWRDLILDEVKRFKDLH